MNIGLIGQRWSGTTPEDLYPKLKQFLLTWLKGLDVTVLHLASGNGVDLAALDAAVDLKLSTVVYEPCVNHHELWPAHGRDRYNQLVRNPNVKVKRTSAHFSPGAYNRRNQQILQAVGPNGLAYVFWDGQGDRGMGQLLVYVSSPNTPVSVSNLAWAWMNS